MTSTSLPSAVDFASLSTEELRYLAVKAEIARDHGIAVATYEALADRDPSPGADWGRISPLANLGRLTDARMLLLRTIQADCAGIRDVLHYDPASAQVPDQYDSRWERDGGGTSHLHPDMLRLVGLAGVGAQYVAELPALDNQHGTWIDVIVRRGSSAEGDCRLEFADGTVREAIFFERNAARLLSGGASAQIDCHQIHRYGLWIHRQTSRLYCDGQLILESNGLPAESARFIRFGVYGTSSGTDSESHWYFLWVRQSVDVGQLPLTLPPAWPVSIWTCLIATAVETADWSTALDLARRARRSYPTDPTIRDTLYNVCEQAYAIAGMRALVRQHVQTLSLDDRSQIVQRQRGNDPTEVLLTCRDMGISFPRHGEHGRAARMLRETILGHRPDPDRNPHSFWAVRHVSFDLQPGDMLGIIGRNGAGKSTLLSALADLIDPNEGALTTRGKVILMSVGTGFQAALTGRENILLSGLYLGMTRREIAERFDELVEFAELWDAIDRPVQFYSAGMISRLQFAIATTINPEILLLDELLGAGDASFVEKAQGRMQQMLRRAHAVVIVTHDTHFVRNNCSQAILLEQGEVLYHGAPDNAVLLYEDLLTRKPKRSERTTPSRP